MTDRPYNVLFLCTANSARSIMAEAILNEIAAGKFRAFSAGSHPKGQINPRALQLLQSLGYDTRPASAPNPGASLPSPARHCSISYSRSVITRPAKPARSGQDNR
jgi:low molecular weight phosphotyrosine protein phosphatase